MTKQQTLWAIFDKNGNSVTRTFESKAEAIMDYSGELVIEWLSDEELGYHAAPAKIVKVERLRDLDLLNSEWLEFLNKKIIEENTNANK